MMVIPMCHVGHQTMVPKTMQTFLYLSISIEYVSNNARFKGPHITPFSFTEAPTNYQDYWLTTFSGHITHESVTPIYYTLLDPHNCSSMTLDPEDEGITVLQYDGNYSPNNTVSHPSRLSSRCSILISYHYNVTSNSCITSVMFIGW